VAVQIFSTTTAAVSEKSDIFYNNFCCILSTTLASALALHAKRYGPLFCLQSFIHHPGSPSAAATTTTSIITIIVANPSTKRCTMRPALRLLCFWSAPPRPKPSPKKDRSKSTNFSGNSGLRLSVTVSISGSLSRWVGTSLLPSPLRSARHAADTIRFEMPSHACPQS
jgi:hypothetical protein